MQASADCARQSPNRTSYKKANCGASCYSGGKAINSICISTINHIYFIIFKLVHKKFLFLN